MTLNEGFDVFIRFIEIVIWPSIVLTVFLCLRNEITLFIHNVKEAELPGGIKLKTIDQEIKKAEELKEVILSEKKDLPIVSMPLVNANEIMVKNGLNTSPSNLNIQFYNELLEKDPRIALAGLRVDLEIMVKNIAKGFKIDIRRQNSMNQIISSLLNNGAITTNQYRLISIINNICTAAIHGEKITKEQALQVFEIAPILINDYISWLEWGFNQ